MPDPAVEVSRLLKEHRAVLVRTKRHQVYRFPNGRVFTMASTPSDFRAAANQLTDLRRTLGIDTERGLPGERREKRCKPGRSGPGRITSSIDPVMLEAMRKAGLLEDRLNDKIAALTIQLRFSRIANKRRRKHLSKMQGYCPACWWCKFKRWWRDIVA